LNDGYMCVEFSRLHQNLTFSIEMISRILVHPHGFMLARMQAALLK